MRGLLSAVEFKNNRHPPIDCSSRFTSEAEADEATRASYRGIDRFGDGLEWDVVETR
jgi:hypothetical protein